MHWDDESEQLFMGLDNGEVHIYKIPREKKMCKFEKVSCLIQGGGG